MEKEDHIRQKEQWKQLSPSEKWQYFMDYYLWVTIGVAAGIAIVIFLIVHFATKTSFVMGVMAVNTDGEHIEATGPDYFTDFLREHGVTSKRDVVNLNYTIWIDPNSDSDVDSTNLSTIQVLFMTRSVDVFFSDEEFLKLMGGTDYLADLRDYLPKELLDRYEDQQIMVLNTMTGETIVAGIRLENNEWVRKTGWYQENAAVGLADLQARAQRRCHRLVHKVDLPGARRHDGLHNGVRLDAGDGRRHADRNARLEDARAADLIDKPDDQLVRHAVVLDDAVPQRAHQVNVRGCAAHHF